MKERRAVEAISPEQAWGTISNSDAGGASIIAQLDSAFGCAKEFDLGGKILAVKHSGLDVAAITDHFEKNRRRVFSWDDPAIQEALWRGKIDIRNEKPSKRSIQKCADSNQGNPAIHSSQCLTCPGLPNGALAAGEMTTEWLLTKMKTFPASYVHDRCLFYTRRKFNPDIMEYDFPFEPEGLSSVANKWACKNGFTTIWNLWPSAADGSLNEEEHRDFYACDKPGNWLSWLHHPDNDLIQLSYFQNMSRAMALTCTDRAYVMSDEPKSVVRSAIWGQFEWPTLQQRFKDGVITGLSSVDTGFEGVEGTQYRLNIDTLAVLPNQRRDGRQNVTAAPVSDEHMKESHTLEERGNSCLIASTYEPSGEDWFG